MSFINLKVPGAERYLQRAPDTEELVLNYHASGFFLRPHEGLHGCIVCIQPADRTRPDFSLDPEFNPHVGILDELQEYLPQDELRELYGRREGEPWGIGLCITGAHEPVLALRTRRPENVGALYDIGTKAIHAWWNDRFGGAHQAERIDL